MRVVYHTNNSGGNWWLNKDQWLALKEAGWVVHFDVEGNWNNRSAPYEEGDAYKDGLTLRQGINEWENLTGLDSTALGCYCCGVPHSFESYDDDGFRGYYSPDYPSFGARHEGD